LYVFRKENVKKKTNRLVSFIHKKLSHQGEEKFQK